MKNVNFLLALGAVVSLAAACNKNLETSEQIDSKSDSVLEFTVSGIDPMTRASSIDPQGNETTVTDVQILLFDDSEKVSIYLDNGALTTGSITVKQGVYTAAAVVNGPDVSGINTLDELKSVSLTLADFNSTASDFVMFGSVENVTVEKKQTKKCSIDVQRLVMRARLASVANCCPDGLGDLTLKRVFLSNVVTNNNLAGSAIPSSWNNRYGRSDISNEVSIIDGVNYLADPEDLSYSDLTGNTVSVGNASGQLAFLYSYPNPESDVVKTYSSVWTPTATRLVIVAELDGNDYYYPVALPASKANTSYDVSVSIFGKGLSDPQGDITDLSDKGSVNVQVSIKEWLSGDEYIVEY